MTFPNDRMVALTEFSVGRASGRSSPGFMRGVGVVCRGVAVNGWVISAGSSVGAQVWKLVDGDGGACWGFCGRPVECKEVRGLPGYLATPPFQSWS